MSRQYKTGLIITGDASGGIKAVRATEQELGRLNQRFDRGTQRARAFREESDNAGTSLGTLRNMAVAAGGAIAATFAAQNIAGQARMIAETDALAKSIGVATSTLQAWSYAGEQVGLQSDKMGDIFKDVSDKLGDFARTGGGEAADLIEQMGLNVQELLRLSPDQQLLKIGEALEGLSDSEATFFLESLGDEAVRLRPLLANNAAQLREYADEARALGVAMDEGAIAGAVEADRAMRQMQGAVTGLTNQLAAGLGPSLSAAAQAATGFVQSMRDDEVTEAEAALRAAAGAAAGVASAYIAVRGALLVATGAQIAFNAAMRANPMMLAVSAAGALAGALITTRDGMSEVERQAQQTSQEVRGLAEGFALLTEQQQINTRSKIVSDMTEWRLEAAKLGAEITKLSELARNSGQLTAQGGAMPVITPEQMARGRQAREELAALITQIGAGTDTLEEMDKILEELGGSGGGIPNLGDASSEAAKAAKEQADALEALRREMDPLRAEHAAYTDRLSVLNQALAEGTVGQQEYGEAVRWAAQQYVRAATGAEEYEKQQKSLVAQYDRHHQKAQQLRDDLAAINEMYRRGDIDGDTYSRMIANVRDEMRQLALDADPFAQDMARAWEEASNRIDETFADAFAGAFDSFDDFADQLLDGFKRLLAELAYQALLRPIVVGFTADMQNLLGLGSGQGGGLSNTISGINSVAGNISKVTDFLGLTSSLGVAGSAPISYATGFGAQVATGTYSGALGSATAAASTSTSGVLSTLSSAAPWIAGGLAIDNILGLGIVDGIVEGIAGIFGDETEPRLNVSTYGQASDFPHESVAEGAFGAVGFSAGTRRSNDLFGGIEQEREWLSMIASMDDMLATVAQTPAELDAMTEAVQGVVISADSAASANEALSERTLAALGAVDSDYTSMLAELELGAGELTQRAADAAATMGLMSTAAERLNLNLGETGELSLTAADSLAQMAGGAQALAAAQQGYYQAVYSETDRLQHQIGDLAASLSGVTDTVPTSTDELRALVEGADLSTEAGQELALQLMQLAPALAQTSDAVERAITEAYQEELDRAPDAGGLTYWMEQVNSGAVTLSEALEYIANSAEAAANEYRDTLTGLLDDLNDAIGARRSDLRDQLDARKDVIAEERDAVLAGIDAQRDALDARRESYQETYQLTQDALSREMEAQREAWDARRSMLQEELGAAQDALSITEGLVSTLSSALDNLVQRSAEQQLIDYRRAQGRLSGMLDAARGGTLPEQDALDRALSGVSDAVTSQYSSREDMLRDTTRTANIVSELSSLAEDQLSADEQAVVALESRLASAERQHSQAMAMLDAQMAANEEAHEAEMRRLADQLDALTLARTQAQEHFALEQERAQAWHDTEIERLDRLYAAAEDQVNQAAGIRSAVQSVSGAIAALSEALTSPASQSQTSSLTAEEIADLLADQSRPDSQPSGSSSGSSGSDSGGSSSSTGGSPPSDPYMTEDDLLADAAGPVADAYRDVLGRHPDEGGYEHYVDELASGRTIDDIRAEMERNRLDGMHADGLWSVPFDGYRAGLHRGETVLPAPAADVFRQFASNPFDMSEVVAELKAVKGQLAYSRDIQRTMAKRMTQMQRVIDDWDRRGQPETREQPA
ncbi:DUF4214 domain-containing protein [Halomonas sp.]|uniref:DUF4214 domain-containing protein n=1 Tax=Halomonas sp. TaxID=1486246 RepID=UPI003D13530E